MRWSGVSSGLPDAARELLRGRDRLLALERQLLKVHVSLLERRVLRGR